MKKIAFFTLLCLASFCGFAQREQIVMGTILDGDTIPLTYLPTIVVNGYACPLSDSEVKAYKKLIANVKKTYPYAKDAGKLLQSYSAKLATAQNESQRKKYMSQAEDDIKNRFGSSLEKLNKTQGKILLKLIDRETGSDSYNLLKDLRGSFRASFYQTIGKVFGYDLKVKFDPQNSVEDRVIERIVAAIEANKI
ncbi:MAG: DUF4294 domain-containing protein [Bacteroidales bacterium]|jgi:hypothetical protein|nr:DUF4294 domain-containing protein [Bacteroidales bacterium]